MARFFYLFLIFSAMLSCGADKEERTSISWWTSNHGRKYVRNMSELPLYQELEERLDLDIRFIHPPAGQHNERLVRLLASGSLPDIISHDFVKNYPGGIVKALLDDAVTPLNTYLPELAPNLNDLIKRDPKLLQYIETGDGSIFCFPSYIPKKRMRSYIGPYIRKDLLEKTGLTPPETLDDWETLLEEFRKDPDIDTPLSFYGGKIRETDAFIGAFGISWGFFQNEGIVYHGLLHPDFIRFIRLFREWYSRGLIDPGFAYNNRNTYEKNARTRTIACLVDYVTSMELYGESLKTKTPGVEFSPVPYPSLYNGTGTEFGFLADPVIYHSSAYLTGNAPPKTKAIELLDYAYSPEGHFLYNGTSQYISGPFVQEEERFDRQIPRAYQKQAVEIWGNTTTESHVLNPLNIPPDHSRQLAGIMNRVKGLSDYYLIDIITGERPLEDLNIFQKELITAGLPEAIGIYQTALNQSEERKE